MIQTVTGNVINPLKFRAEDITLEELAHALACQNRFFGHARFPISIAQHAVSVSLLATGFEMQGLHHDDSEALLGDINKWLKQSECFKGYREIEEEIQTQFYRKFHCPDVTSIPVTYADRLAVRCEMVFAFGRNYTEIAAGYGPPTNAELFHFVETTKFTPNMSWEEAKTLYIKRHHNLMESETTSSCISV